MVRGNQEIGRFENAKGQIKMRKCLPDKLQAGRIISGKLATSPAAGPFGAFFVYGPCACKLRIVASGACTESEGWEHVSISIANRPPNWQEMCFVKDLFWEPEECVVQFHPPESAYINNHPYCLHLWKPPFDFPLPPSILIGIKDAGLLNKESAAALRRKLDGEH